MRILLAEDEKTIAITLRDALEEVGHRVEWVADGREAKDELKRVAYDALVSDIRMPGLDGMQLLAFARTLEPAPAVVMITGYATVEQAVEAMQKGAETYVQKPFPNAYVVRLLEQIQRRRTLESANQELRRRLDHGQALDELVGRSRAMLEVAVGRSRRWQPWRPRWRRRPRPPPPAAAPSARAARARGRRWRRQGRHRRR